MTTRRSEDLPASVRQFSLVRLVTKGERMTNGSEAHRPPGGSKKKVKKGKGSKPRRHVRRKAAKKVAGKRSK